MVNYAIIKMWGMEVGAVSMNEASGRISFEYTSEFVRTGINLSPIFVSPERGRIYSFPELRYETFKGLPGFLADALPDNFGNALINQWLAQEGREANSYNTIERLLYQGSRAMGALEFEPSRKDYLNKSVKIELAGLIKAAIQVLSGRTDFSANLGEGEEALRTILRVGTSAGGARAKAVIAYNKQTGELHQPASNVNQWQKRWIPHGRSIVCGRKHKIEKRKRYCW